ncbi:hypothetical protein [Salana multivorans]
MSGTVVRVDVQHLPKPTSRTKKTLWLWVSGSANTHPDLEICWRAYLRPHALSDRPTSGGSHAARRLVVATCSTNVVAWTT